MRRFTPVVLIAALGACADSLAPVPEDVVGSYSATTLSFTTIAGSTDFLAGGGALFLQLRADGTLAGQLFHPGPNGLDQDLSGIWTWSRTLAAWRSNVVTITFHPTAETFLSQLTFVAEDNGTLRAEDRPAADAGILVILTPAVVLE